MTVPRHQPGESPHIWVFVLEKLREVGNRMEPGNGDPPAPQRWAESPSWCGPEGWGGASPTNTSPLFPHIFSPSPGGAVTLGSHPGIPSHRLAAGHGTRSRSPVAPVDPEGPPSRILPRPQCSSDPLEMPGVGGSFSASFNLLLHSPSPMGYESYFA